MKSTDILEELGISKGEMVDKAVDRIVHQLLHHCSCDEDGEPHEIPSEFSRQLQKRVIQSIDDAIGNIAGKNIFPNLEEMVASVSLQQTNKWGEQTGKEITFREYLVNRAEKYITEQVDFRGKTQAEDGYSWKPHQTRLAHMIDEHLHYKINSAIQEALTSANSQLANGIVGTVKICLEGILKNIKTEVKIK